MPLQDSVESKPLAEFSEKAYLDYAMYVILDRALPHVGDGLKPVQRRIIYAMSELGLKASAKYKKSARTVGDVLGKFHPHGDSACYEAMVLMAQSFSYRYPFIDGQGNWGSADDPKSFAAMRYTESRLSAYADVMLSEVSLGTVDWVPNFDGSLEEPSLLPARLPNILLNGGSGIAVGMATDIPPHNMREVAKACVHLLEHPRASVDDICEYIQGPDYPTNAEIITPREDIIAMYSSGRGSVKMRAIYRIEAGDIVVTALPHQVSGEKILEQIAQQMQAKKLPMVADLRDESDHENPTRLVIMPRSNRVDTEQLMSHLFASTDLERNYRVNMNMIGLDGRPAVRSLDKVINEWLSYRLQTVQRRLQYRLDKILARLHLLDGLLLAFLNIDEVITIIREQEKPKSVLMQRFNLSELQADAILDMKLRHLARLEEIKIRTEQDELSTEREQLEKILGSERRMKTLVRKEIEQDAEQYGDDRRSPLVTRVESKAMKEEDMLPNEPITVVLSQKGWVRAAKGHDVDGSELNYRAGDSFKAQVHARSNQSVIFFDSTGRAYALAGHSLPSARGQGEPLTGRLTLTAGAQIDTLFAGDPESFVLLGQDSGYGFIANTSDLQVKNKSGKVLMKLTDSAKILSPRAVGNIEQQSLAVVTSEGRLLLFNLSELPQLSRGKGNKIIQIPSARAASREEVVVDMTVLGEDDQLILYAGKRHLSLKAKDLLHYRGERGRRGNRLPRGFQRVEAIGVKARGDVNS